MVVAPAFSLPSVFEPLIAELASDHRVITYDPRGCGRSSREGPFDMATDVEDLAALLEELGEPTVIVAPGDAFHRAVKAAYARPEAVPGVISPGITPLGPQSGYDRVGEGLASSPEVVGALIQLLESDYRSGLRTALEAANPQLDEAGLRERISAVADYTPREGTLARLKVWVEDDAREEGRALGDRVWVLYFRGNAWFPAQLAGQLRRELPDGHVEEVEDGALSRPDITAAIVRQITRC
jgi:pimeloyl-ACP methyl ester carboxylesterase